MAQQKSIREAFATRFGEDNTEAIEAAAAEHYGEWISRPDGMDAGSDPFKTLLCFAIGFECMTRFRDAHGITAEPEELKAWVRENADLRDHDGDLDYLGLMAGAYDEWLTSETEVSP